MLADVVEENELDRMTLDVARISAEQANRFKVTGSSATAWADRAFSCTVRPRVGDRVLVSRCGPDETYILSILKRGSTSHSMEVEFPGDVTFKAPRGRIHVVAADELRMSSASRMQMLSPSLVQRSEHARVVSRRIDVDGDEVETNFQQARIYGGRLESVVDTAMQCAKTVARKVENIETLNVGTFIKTVRDTLNIRSKHSVWSSRHDLKIDAERIHMG